MNTFHLVVIHKRIPRHDMFYVILKHANEHYVMSKMFGSLEELEITLNLKFPEARLERRMNHANSYVHEIAFIEGIPQNVIKRSLYNEISLF